MSTHNPNHAKYLNSQVVLMDKGTIVKYGDSDTIINNEVLRDIYGNSICYSSELPYNEISFKD